MLRAASVSSSRMTYFTVASSNSQRCHDGIPALVPRTGRARIRHARLSFFRLRPPPLPPPPPAAPLHVLLPPAHPRLPGHDGLLAPPDAGAAGGLGPPP